MERKIGKLGLSPMNATGFGHSGSPGRNGGPEFYLRDRQNLNIVYSVYYSPKTKEEIAEELAITPVYLEEKINFLEENGFLVKTAGNRYTTYVRFDSGRYSLELQENRLKLQLRIAEILAEDMYLLSGRPSKRLKTYIFRTGTANFWRRPPSSTAYQIDAASQSAKISRSISSKRLTEANILHGLILFKSSRT